MKPRRRGKLPKAGMVGASALALLVWLAPIGIVHAIDFPPPGGTRDLRLTLELSLDATSLHSSWAGVNATVAPFGGMYDSGFRLRLSVGRSWYEYLASDSPRILRRGNSTETNILAGYGLALPRVSLIGLIGVASSDSVDEGVGRSARGAKAVVSAYANPSARSMAYVSFAHTAIHSVSQLQAKLGAKLPGNFFIGPEVNVTWRRGNPWNTHATIQRAGFHLSSMQMGPWYLSASGGWVRDHDLGSGRYLSLGIYGGF